MIRLRDAAAAETHVFALIVRESGTYAGSVEQLIDPGRRRRSRIRVALLDGQVCGFGALVPSAANNNGRAELDFLYVHERWRRHGVGRALIEDLRLLCHAAGISALDVVAHPLADAFFRHIGATRVGTHQAHTHRNWSCPTFEIAATSGQRQHAPAP